MLNGDGNDNSKKSVGLKLAKKKQLYTSITLLQTRYSPAFYFFNFLIFVFFARLQRETS